MSALEAVPSLSLRDEPARGVGDDDAPDAINDEVIRAMAAPVEDGAATTRGSAEDPDAT
jgi:hypothetical protein